VGRIDLKKIVGLRRDEVGRRMGNLADLIVAEWTRHANNELHATAPDYTNAITITERGRTRVRVELLGTLPNIVEQGMGPSGVGSYGPYKVSDLLLRTTTKQVRRTKDGRLYVNVPMHFSAADIARLGGDSTADLARKMRPSLTRPLRDRVRPADTNLVRPQDMEHGTRWGDRLPGRSPTDPLRGVVRLDKVYSQATQGVPQQQYLTWRRVIQGGKDWWSSGVKPRRLSDRVVVDMGRLIGLAFHRTT